MYNQFGEKTSNAVMDVCERGGGGGGGGDRAHDFKKNVNHINTKSYIIKKNPVAPHYYYIHLMILMVMHE